MTDKIINDEDIIQLIRPYLHFGTRGWRRVAEKCLETIRPYLRSSHQCPGAVQGLIEKLEALTNAPYFEDRYCNGVNDSIEIIRQHETDALINSCENTQELADKVTALYGDYKPELTPEQIESLKKDLHYPECWDTMAYPTLFDALNEIANCSEHPSPSAEPAESVVERVTEALRDAMVNTPSHKEYTRESTADWLVILAKAAIASMPCGNAQKEIERLEKLVYVPGLWKCAKCNCATISTNLHVNTGGFSANNKPQICPNECGSMWRVTERDAGNDLANRLEELFEENKKLKAKLESQPL